MCDLDNNNNQEIKCDSDEQNVHIRDPFSENSRVQNPIRCPFADTTSSVRQTTTRQSKRTQRYRSTAQSRLGDMTVGDIRYCFQQLRNAGDDLSPEMILYNGQCAGEFALKYLTETSNAMRKRRKKTVSKKDETSSEEEIETPMFPESQLPDSSIEPVNAHILNF